jgi:hypothetical protein
MTASRWRLAGIPLAVTVLFAGSFAGSAWASHQFGDVPDSNPFHDDIGAVADAGITTGFADDNFHPNDPISRQAMAAFLHRGLGRVQIAHGGLTFSDTAPHVVATATIAPPTDAGLNGFVVAMADAHFNTSSETLCPCEVGLTLRAGAFSGGQVITTLGNVPTSNGTVSTSVSENALFIINPAEPLSVTANLQRLNSITADPFTTGIVNLLVLYVPFSGDGDNSP